MTRLGYILLIAAVIALAGYVFWPEKSDSDTIERLWSGGTDYPGRYQLRLGALRQSVVLPLVTVQGVERPLDPGLHERLWNRVRIIGAATDRVVRDVGPDKLAAYGVKEDRRLECDALVLGWGRSESGGYVWDGRSRRLLVVDRETVDALDQAAGRLDFPVLLHEPLHCRTAVVGGVTLARDGAGHWRDQANPFRPSFDQRLTELIELVQAAKLERFDVTVPADATVIGEAQLALEGGRIHHLSVSARQDAGWLRIDGQPPQLLDAPSLAGWRMGFEDLRSDMLFDIALHAADSPLVEVHVARAGKRLFRLEKHGINDVDRDGSSRWDVAWDGGRETADSDAASRIAQACDRLRVTRVAPRGGAAEPADALTIDFVFSVRHDRLRVALAPVAGGWEAWSGTHRGRVEELPPLLAEASADACLDTALSTRPAFRVAKVQRQVVEGATVTGEVFVSEKGQGAWRRTFPAAEARRPVNQLAVDRLVRSLCTARGRSARLLRPADRDIIEHPAFTLALRFVPVVERRSEDGTRLGDTTDQDWLVAFGRSAEGWRAVDRDGGVSWLMDDDLVAILRQPLGDDLVFPIVASLVRRIDIVAPLGRYRLVEDGGRWTLTIFDRGGGNRSGPADGVEVRRYLRLLAGLRAQRRAGAGPIPSDQALGSVVCELPDVGDEKAQAALTVGRATGDLAPVAAITSREDQHLGNDLMLVTAAEAALLLPAPTVFAAADNQP